MREQWNQLKSGDVLVSPAGREREIISITGNCVTFAALSWKTGRTTYTMTDLWNTYSVKEKKRRTK